MQKRGILCKGWRNTNTHKVMRDIGQKMMSVNIYAYGNLTLRHLDVLETFFKLAEIVQLSQAPSCKSWTNIKRVMVALRGFHLQMALVFLGWNANDVKTCPILMSYSFSNVHICCFSLLCIIVWFGIQESINVTSVLLFSTLVTFCCLF